MYFGFLIYSSDTYQINTFRIRASYFRFCLLIPTYTKFFQSQLSEKIFTNKYYNAISHLNINFMRCKVDLSKNGYRRDRYFDD